MALQTYPTFEWQSIVRDTGLKKLIGRHGGCSGHLELATCDRPQPSALPNLHPDRLAIQLRADD